MDSLVCTSTIGYTYWLVTLPNFMSFLVVIILYFNIENKPKTSVAYTCLPFFIFRYLPILRP